MDLWLAALQRSSALWGLKKPRAQLPIAANVYIVYSIFEICMYDVTMRLLGDKLYCGNVHFSCPKPSPKSLNQMNINRENVALMLLLLSIFRVKVIPTGSWTSTLPWFCIPAFSFVLNLVEDRISFVFPLKLKTCIEFHTGPHAKEQKAA